MRRVEISLEGRIRVRVRRGVASRNGLHQRRLEMSCDRPRKHINDIDAEGFDFWAQRIGDGLQREFRGVVGAAAHYGDPPRD